MNPRRIGLVASAMLMLAVFAPLVPHAHASVGTVKWMNQVFVGTDPFYSMSVNGYQAGSTATLAVPISYENPYGGAYINVTSVRLSMNWNGNYTNTNLLRIDLNNQRVVMVTFQVPDNTVATNLNTYLGSLVVNYTTPASPGTKQWFVFSTPRVAVYSAEQATSITIMQQLGLLSGGFLGTSTLCGVFGTQAFKTAQGNSLCQQALQSANIGAAHYSAGNFATSKTDLERAQSLYNQALSSESSTGGNVDLSATVGGWGTLLLGIGAVIAGASLILFARRTGGMGRPRTSAGSVPTPA